MAAFPSILLSRTFLLLAGALLTTWLPQPSRAQDAAVLAADHSFASGDFDNARKEYADAIKHNPSLATVRFGLIRTLLRLDLWPDALAEAQTDTKQFLQNADAHGLLALCLMRAGQPDDAGEQAKQSLILDKDNYWGLVATGRVAEWNLDGANARQAFRRASVLRPGEPDAWLGLLSAAGRDSTAEADQAAQNYLHLAPQGQPHTRDVEDLQDQTANAAYWKLFEHDLPFQAIAPISEANLKAMETNGGIYTTTLPIEREDDSIILPVQIDGQIFRLMFDTGAGYSLVLNSHAAHRLKLSRRGDSFGRGVTGKEPSTLMKAATLTLGGLTLGSVPLSVIGYNESGKLFDGLFGSEILAKYIITLDLEKQMMTLSRGKGAAAPKPAPERQMVALPFHIHESHIFLPIKAGTQPLWALFDTGYHDNAESIRLTHALSDGIPYNDYIYAYTVQGRFGVGKTDTKVDFYSTPRVIRISLDDQHGETGFLQDGLDGESTLDKQISPMEDFEVGMVLGAPVISLYPRVSIDYRRQLLTVEYLPVASDPPDALVSGK